MENLLNHYSFLKRKKNERLFNVSGLFNKQNYLIEINDYKDNDFREVVIASLTICHEKKHWYQYVGSSLGYFYSCLNQTNQNILLGVIRNLNISLPMLDFFLNNKELINNIFIGDPSKFGYHVSEENQSLLNGFDFTDYTIKKVSSLEYLIYILEGNYTQKEFEENFDIFKNNNLDDILHDTLEDMGRLHGIIDLNLINNFLSFQEAVSDKEPQALMHIRLPDEKVIFGTNHILEAHARFNEVILLDKYIDKYFYDEKMYSTLLDLKNKLLSDATYTVAFKIYKKLIGIKSNYEQFIFLLVCDYACNVPIFKGKDMYYENISINSFLPQNRFIEICKILKKYPLKNLDLQSISDYNNFISSIYEFISVHLRFISPLEISKEFLQLFQRKDRGVLLQNNLYTLDFGIDRYIRACKIRLKYPLFFISPDLFQILDKDHYNNIVDFIGHPILGVKGELRSSNKNDSDLVSYFEHAISTDFINDIFLKSYINGSNYFNIGKTKEEIYDFCHQIFGKDFKQYIK